MLKHFLPIGVIASVFLVAVGTAQASHAPMHGVYGKGPGPNATMHPPYARSGKHQRPRFGIAISAISQTDLDKLSLEYGIRVENVNPGSVADRAGVKPGDIVTGINDRPAYSPQRTQHLINQATDKITISLMRDGDDLKLQGRFPKPEAIAADTKAYLGIRMQPMTDELKEAFGATGDRGVLVSQVDKDSAAQQAGLKAGDVLTSVGDKAVTSVRDVHRALAGHSAGDAVSIGVLRNREAQTINAELGGKPKMAWQHPMHRYGPKGYGYYGKHYHHPYGSMKGKGCYHPRHGAKRS